MTTLAEELRARQTVTMIKFAEEFAEKMKEQLVESAEKGYLAFEYYISSNNENGHILINRLFIDKLNDLMGDVKVTLDQREKTNIFFKTKYYDYYIVFSWKDKENQD